MGALQIYIDIDDHGDGDDDDYDDDCRQGSLWIGFRLQVGGIRRSQFITMFCVTRYCLQELKDSRRNREVRCE